MMGVNLTSGVISKIMTGKCTSDDLKPVLQVVYIDSRTSTIDNKQWQGVGLSDGSFRLIGIIADEIVISKRLQKGSILQLTMFQLTKLHKGENNYIITSNTEGFIPNKSGLLGFELTVIQTKCDIIGEPQPLPDNDQTPLVETTTPTIPDDNHVDEPPTSVQNPPTSTQNCSAHSPTQNKKRKLQSTEDAISVLGKDISDVMKMMVEVTNVVPLLCKKLDSLKEDVSRKMMEKDKEVNAGFKKLETLQEDVSKMAKMMMEKNKEDDIGACFKKLETFEEDISKMAKTMIDKNKEDDVGACFKNLETLKEDVSKLTRMVMEKSKEDDMGACIEKLDKMGWGAQEPIYDTALLLFLKGADYRKLWLHLKPECCEKWVKIAGSIFGLLD